MTSESVPQSSEPCNVPVEPSIIECEKNLSAGFCVDADSSDEEATCIDSSTKAYVNVPITL